jgi:hypothetical protein
MGSFVHPQTFLVLEAIKRMVDNVRCSGGVVPAVAEARRLAATYPEASLSEDAILAEFRQQAALYCLPVDEALPAARGNACAGSRRPSQSRRDASRSDDGE